MAQYSSWKPVDMTPAVASSSSRKRMAPPPKNGPQRQLLSSQNDNKDNNENSESNPSEASTDVSSSTASGEKEGYSGDEGNGEDSAELDDESGSHSDDEDSETESMKMRRILYGSTKSNNYDDENSLADNNSDVGSRSSGGGSNQSGSRSGTSRSGSSRSGSMSRGSQSPSRSSASGSISRRSKELSHSSRSGSISPGSEDPSHSTRTGSSSRGSQDISRSSRSGSHSHGSASRSDVSGSSRPSRSTHRSRSSRSDSEDSRSHGDDEGGFSQKGSIHSKKELTGDLGSSRRLELPSSPSNHSTHIRSPSHGGSGDESSREMRKDHNVQERDIDDPNKNNVQQLSAGLPSSPVSPGPEIKKTTDGSGEAAVSATNQAPALEVQHSPDPIQVEHERTETPSSSPKAELLDGAEKPSSTAKISDTKQVETSSRVNVQRESSAADLSESLQPKKPREEPPLEKVEHVPLSLFEQQSKAEEHTLHGSQKLHGSDGNMIVPERLEERRNEQTVDMKERKPDALLSDKGSQGKTSNDPNFLPDVIDQKMKTRQQDSFARQEATNESIAKDTEQKTLLIGENERHPNLGSRYKSNEEALGNNGESGFMGPLSMSKVTEINQNRVDKEKSAASHDENENGLADRKSTEEKRLLNRTPQRRVDCDDRDNWNPKPPALTTYGSSPKYVPQGESRERHDPIAGEPPGGLAPRYTTAAKNSAPSSPPFLKSAKNLNGEKLDKKKIGPDSPPPLSEVTVTPPPDDESTLGTEGTYLERFPKKKKKTIPPRNETNPIAEEMLKDNETETPTPMQHGNVGPSNYDVPESIQQTIANFVHDKVSDSAQEKSRTSEYRKQNFQQKTLEENWRNDESEDYFKAWARPGSSFPKPKQGERIDPPERKDPPGGVSPFAYIRQTPETSAAMVDSENSDNQRPSPSTTVKPLYNGVNREALSSTSPWVPRERKGEIRNANSSPTSPLHLKSDRSMVSTWAPPGVDRSTRRNEVVLDSKRLYVDAIMAQKRSISPEQQRHQREMQARSSGRTARVDFTGNVSSSIPLRTSSKPEESEPDRSPASSSVSSSPSQYSKLQSSHNSRSSRSFRHHDKSDTSRGNSEWSESTGHQEPMLFSPRPLLAPPSTDGSSSSTESYSVLVVDDIGNSQKNTTDPAASEQAPQRNSDASTYSPPEQGLKQDMRQSIKGKRCTATNMVLVTILVILVMGGIGVGIYFLVVQFQNSGDSPFSPSQPTSSPEIDTSIEGLRDLVVFVSPETKIALENSLTPQSLALDWLAGNQFLSTYSNDQLLQRFVLATLYYSTNGETWTRDDSWLSDIAECDWYSSESDVQVCTSEGVLDEIDLDTNGLSGILPWDELTILRSQLLVLDVFSNNIIGSINSQVGELTSLIALDLERNKITGTIPREVQQLTTMQHLLLSENSITGTLPREIAKMENLVSLRVSQNSLRGSVPSELGQLTKLSNLFLEGNNFSGTIPQELCDLDIENFVVDCDLISCSCCSCGSDSPPVESPKPGILPGEETPTDGSNLATLILDAYPGSEASLQDPSSPQSQALQWLNSSDNNNIVTEEKFLQRYALATLYYSTNGDEWIDSTAWLSSTDECSWISSANSLDVCDDFGRYVAINLQENNLSGIIPREITILSSSLKTINLRGNEISGEVPTFLVDLVNLETLELASNNFLGPLPRSLFDIEKLKRLSLFENNIVLTVPSEIGQLSRLEVLDLGSNQLSGSLPSEVGLLTRLAGLSVFDNFFTGTLPSEIADLELLQHLYVDSNEFRSPLDTDICLLALNEFWSDCEEIQCVCCTTCCSDGFGCFET